VAVNYREQRTGIDTGIPPALGQKSSEGSGTRQSISYVDQFADRKIGIALGFVKFDEQGAIEGSRNNWGGWSMDRMFNGQSAKIPGGMGGDFSSINQNREGQLAVLQYKPNKDFESTIDFMKSKGSTFKKATGIEGNVGANCPGDLNNFCYDAPSALTAATIVGGVAQSGTINNWKGVVRNHFYGDDDKLESLGWNNKFKVGDWASTVDLGRSKVEKAGGRFETTAGIPGSAQKGVTTGSLSWTGLDSGMNAAGGFTSSINYADPNIIRLTDVMGWSGDTKSDGTVKIRAEDTPQAGYVAQPLVKDSLSSLRLSTKRALDFGAVSALELGANLTDRTKISEAREGRLVIKGSVDANGKVIDPYASAPIPGAGVSATPSGINVVSWNPTGSLGTIYDYAPKFDSGILPKDWKVEEKVTTSFIKADLEGKIFGMSYTGNFGLQWARTDQSSTGYNLDEAQCAGNTIQTCPPVNVSGGAQYNDLNPSLNLSFPLGRDQVVRLGAARVMSRPNMSDMRAGFSFGLDTSSGAPVLRGGGGNPDIKPFRANALDLSYERYFGNKGYVSVAGFYKDLSSYIYSSAQSFDFKPYVTAKTPLPPSGSTVGFLTVPRNGNGGSISGVELAVSVPLSMVSSSLDGLGIQVNHSTTDSAITIPSSGVKTVDAGGDADRIPLPGLSKQVTNLRVYYEKHGFQLAVSQRSRSKFLGEIVDPVNDQRGFTYVKGESIVDVQLGYGFSTGFLRGLSVLFQANNVTKEKFIQYNPKSGDIVREFNYGMTYLLGLNYRLGGN
jgi:iron complex outermembrane receptor protein